MHTHLCKALLFSLAGLISSIVIHSVRAIEADETSNSHQFSEEQKNWWAVQPLQSRKVDGPGNPIDFFVQRKLRDQTLTLAKEAGPYEFIRRAKYDLLGLPPQPKEVEGFVQSWKKNPASAKMELIDRLLADRAYGERWATHWLDVVRFSESDGYRADGFRPSAHLYRDYVVRSLNEDKPYDQFVREQLAGDEINPDDYDHMVATGFLRHGVYEWNQRNARMQWALILNEMTNVTGEVFLGLGMGCAQCHNHPFDKWKQKDYYEMAAYTYGMDTRIDPTDVINVGKKMSKMEKRAERRKSKDRGKTQQVRRAVRDLLEPLRYKVTHKEEKKLKLPDDYQYDDAKPNEVVSASTLFGNSVSGRSSKKLQDYANWMTSNDNPRFARVIANRLWKRVMGVGLVEPVDDFRDDTHSSNPDLMAYLEDTMVEVGFDMRRFQAILYNTRTYQRESTPDDINIDDYHFPGPALKRMTGEQIWDSVLTTIITAPDERKKSDKYRQRYVAMKKRAEGLESLRKQPQVILNAAMEIADVEYAHEQKTKNLRAQIAKAREQDQDDRAKKLTKDMRAAGKDRDKLVDQIKNDFEAGFGGDDNNSMIAMTQDKKASKKTKKKTVYEDMRWKGFSRDYVRSSELRSPAPTEHFLRQFGQSDRETIQAGHTEASVSQVLSLLNGKIYDQLINKRSVLWRGITQLYDAEEKQDFLFQSMLTRLPTDDERAIMDAQFAKAEDDDEACKGIIWALLNTQELLFVQ